MLVGLTGGIGSGKSTVAAMLAASGAATVDADVIAHEVMEPGGPAHAAVAARFASAVVAEDGTIDRSQLAVMVFADSTARADLEAIVHPAVRFGVAERSRAAIDGGASVVVIEIPLLAESPASSTGLAGVVVVDCPEETAVRRLLEKRGMTEAGAASRVAAQATRAQRLAIADFVIDNGGNRRSLEAEVERCWVWIRGLQERV